MVSSDLGQLFVQELAFGTYLAPFLWHGYMLVIFVLIILFSTMLRNILKVSFRNLRRDKVYSFINVLGLTAGIAAGIFILLWITDELSFDDFHSESDRIYSVMINNHQAEGRIDTYSATPAILKEALVSEIPEVELAARYSFETELLIKHSTLSFQENGIYADPDLFSILSFPLTSGNKTKPIEEQNTIAISQRLASKLFQEENPIGKTVAIGEGQDLTVSEVFENVPDHSSLQFDFVIPFELFLKENPWTQHWASGGSRTLVLLRENSSIPNNKIASLISDKCQDCTTTPFLFPFKQQRLYGEFENGVNIGGKIQQVYLFAGVALLILAMACINFMNLSTARSASRSREVGIRKTIGASRIGLIVQFISESVLLAWIALILALILVQLMLPFFNQVTGKSMVLDLSNPMLLAGMLGITIFTGLMAGSYPALVLSGFNPSRVLKGDTRAGLAGGNIRKGLVVAQFAASAVLVIGSLAVYKQINYISERNLGFDRENILVLDQNEGMIKAYEGIKNELLQLPGVESIAFGGNNIFSVPITSTDPIWTGKSEQTSVNFKIYRCDAGFLPTLNIPLLQGRNFRDQRDASNYLINKKAAEMMGLTLEDAVGAKLEMWQGAGEIVGITEDFHNDNLKFGIQPMIFMYSEQVGNHYFIRLSDDQSLDELVGKVAAVYKKHNPDYPFEYSFLNEVFDQEYRLEQVIGKLSLAFTFLAIGISCLGLFGLALFTAEHRAKEIGVRKVLGASVANLVLMLCRDFAALVGVSLLIGFPLAWILIDKYLSGYSFHTEIHWTLYLGVAFFMLLLTLGSVGYQSIKVAVSNPVDSLQSEG